MNAKRIAGVILPAALVLATACSLGRDTPPLEQYVLGAAPTASAAALSDGVTGAAIGVRRLDLASYLAVPAIIVRRGEHQVIVSQYHRWGEDLADGINRVVARYLRETTPVRSVDVAPWQNRTQHDFLVQIRIARFEGTTAEQGMEGGAHVVAEWEISRPAGGTLVARGTTDFSERGWTVGDYAGLVVRLDRGLASMAADIAACIARLDASAPVTAEASSGVQPLSCVSGESGR